MKLTKQILIIIVFLAGIVALYAGYLAFSDPDKGLEIMHISPPPAEIINSIIGLFSLSFALIYFFDAYLLFKRRQAGRSLALLVGFTSLISGFILHFKYHELHIDAGAMLGLVEAGKGALILLLAWIAKD